MAIGVPTASTAGPHPEGNIGIHDNNYRRSEGQNVG